MVDEPRTYKYRYLGLIVRDQQELEQEIEVAIESVEEDSWFDG
jgi:hypothetical protein